MSPLSSKKLFFRVLSLLIPIAFIAIDTNSIIMFEALVDTLCVAESEKDGEIYFEFADGVLVSDDVCTVDYTSAYRYDSQEYYSLDVDYENEIEYMKENASVRFNKPGTYLLSATLGAADGHERIGRLIRTEYRGDVYFSQPEVVFMVTVTEETSSEGSSEEKDDIRYNKNVFSISGITGYDESRTVMYDNLVALCTSPVEITAESDLVNMMFTKLEEINGEWVETRYFDGFAVNLGDTTKNWYPAEGFEYTDDECFEFTGEKEEYTEEDMFVKKGTSISFKEPGMYTVWGDSESGDYTGLTFEIREPIAKYTNSKVLVDGKENSISVGLSNELRKIITEL